MATNVDEIRKYLIDSLVIKNNITSKLSNIPKDDVITSTLYKIDMALKDMGITCIEYIAKAHNDTLVNKITIPIIISIFGNINNLQDHINHLQKSYQQDGMYSSGSDLYNQHKRNQNYKEDIEYSDEDLDGHQGLTAITDDAIFNKIRSSELGKDIKTKITGMSENTTMESEIPIIGEEIFYVVCKELMGYVTVSLDFFKAERLYEEYSKRYPKYTFELGSVKIVNDDYDEDDYDDDDDIF